MWCSRCSLFARPASAERLASVSTPSGGADQARRVVAGAVHVRRSALCACARASFSAPVLHAAGGGEARAGGAGGPPGPAAARAGAAEGVGAAAAALPQVRGRPGAPRAPPGVMAACSSLCEPCQRPAHAAARGTPILCPCEACWRPGLTCMLHRMRACVPYVQARLIRAAGARTGVAAGLVRVLVQGWRPEAGRLRAGARPAGGAAADAGGVLQRGGHVRGPAGGRPPLHGHLPQGARRPAHALAPEPPQASPSQCGAAECLIPVRHKGVATFVDVCSWMSLGRRLPCAPGPPDSGSAPGGRCWSCCTTWRWWRRARSWRGRARRRTPAGRSARTSSARRPSCSGCARRQRRRTAAPTAARSEASVSRQALVLACRERDWVACICGEYVR